MILCQSEIPLSFNGIYKVAVAIPLSFNGIYKVAVAVERNGYSNFINAVKRQRNLGLDSLPDSIDFLALSHSNITVEVDENTGASTSSASSFELQALSNSRTENVLKNLLPDNDGFDDLISQSS